MSTQTDRAEVHGATSVSASNAPAIRYAYDPETDKLHDECGVFGVYGQDDAAALVRSH